MSGVEVAGLVLGALPLMISALEHYRETAEVLEGWWKIKTEYRKCLRNLKYHRLAFEENLEELLLPLIADDAKLQLLLKDPGGPAWKEKHLEEMLQERMPKTYESYSDTIDMMLETVEALHDALGMDKVHFQARMREEYMIEKTSLGTKAVTHVTSIGLSQNFEFQTQRIKLAFNKAGRQQLFDDFGAQNARLRDILGSSDRLASLRQARVTKSPVNAGLWKFWKHGNLLFNLLTEAWSCKCQSLHHANLLLQHRIVPAVNFRIVFWFNRQLAAEKHPWSWQDTSIKLFEGSDITTIKTHLPLVVNGSKSDVDQGNKMAHMTPPISPATSSPLKPSHNINQIANSKYASKSKGKSLMGMLKPLKGLKATLPGPEEKQVTSPSQAEKQTSTSSLLTYASSTQSSIDSIAKPKMKSKVSFVDIETPSNEGESLNPKITDLCAKIASCSADLSNYGCLKGDERLYIVQPLEKAATEPQEHVTLEALLSTSSPVTFTRRQRLQVALILASSYIQLHPTPWLQSKWSKKDILFLYDPREQTKICIDQPYVSRSLSKSLQQHSTLPPNISTTNTYTFQDSIRNLGIMLLELCFGTAIENHKLRQTLTGTDEQTLQLINFAVATQWSRDVLEEAGPEYADAVTWCLHNVPDSGDVEGKEDRWRGDMHVNVVEKLKYCHDQLMAVQKAIS